MGVSNGLEESLGSLVKFRWSFVGVRSDEAREASG
jgi:hypothetical protein